MILYMDRLDVKVNVMVVILLNPVFPIVKNAKMVITMWREYAKNVEVSTLFVKIASVLVTLTTQVSIF